MSSRLAREATALTRVLVRCRTFQAPRNAVKRSGRFSTSAPLGLLGRLGEALDQAGELFDSGVHLAVLAGGVAGVDALEDDRQLPVAERFEEAELGEVAAGAFGVAVAQLLAGG